LERVVATAVWVAMKAKTKNCCGREKEEKKADEKTNFIGGKTQWYLIYSIAIGSLQLDDQQQESQNNNI